MTDMNAVEVISLAGELDIGRKQEVRDALDVREPGSPLLVDFSDVTYADSTVIAELLRFRNDADRLERRVAIVITSPQFDRLITYAGLRSAFDIFEDDSQARAFLLEAGS
jgi:anti-anti-sigma factor